MTIRIIKKKKKDKNVNFNKNKFFYYSRVFNDLIIHKPRNHNPPELRFS